MKTILYIDDNALLLKLTSIFLEKHGFKVYAASDGNTGIEIAKQQHPDIILCDISMPGKTGYDVFKELQEYSNTAIIPFIFISAKSEHQDIRDGMQLGADDYITKPFNNDQLLLALNARLKRQEQIRKISNEKTKEFVDEIETKNKILKQAFEIIRSKNKDMVASIEYAQQIQQAILAPSKFLNDVFEDSFIIYKPKAIVSGDFYWFEQKENFSLFAAVDCTGHGVPGALLSIIGYSLLNQAVNVQNLTNPSEILSFVNNTLICTLNQKVDHTKVKESMDIALCAYDKNTQNLYFSGAGNPLYLFKSGKLIRFKPDYHTLGSFEDESDLEFKYTLYNVKINIGDTIYIFSDGFADQFGGEKRKKMLARGFRELLTNVNHLPMCDQKSALLDHFDNWKREYDQTDDVLIIGIRL